MATRQPAPWLSVLTVVVLVATLVAVACSVNPATGRRQLALIGEQQEVAIGRDNDGKIAAELGLYADPALQAWAEGVGRRLAATSERAQLEWHFKVLDDDTVNAFALPGGYVYLTRGILAHFGSEAQMASVVGHEIGHVTARHSVEQMSRASLAQLGLGVAMVMSEEARKYGQLAQLGLGLMMLKFSRDDERQSDDLGLRYLGRAGYDPDEMPPVFAMLGRQSALSGGRRLPTWQSTHPDPEQRAARLRQQVAALPAERREGTVERDSYLARLDGLPFGPDPREGYLAGGTFYHPGMAFLLRFPPGWQVDNQKRAVSAGPKGGGAVITLTLASEPSAKAAAQAFASRQGITRGEQLQATFFAFRAVPEVEPGAPPPSALDGLVRFVDHDGRVLRLLAYGSEQGWASAHAAARATLGSFARLSDRAHLEVEPKRVTLHRVERAGTLADVAGRTRSSVDVATLAALNNLDPNQQLAAGTTLKLVVGGVLPGS